MESELWGHERSAFAGADSRREGFLAMAYGGTLLLDEITELKVDLQARLLRTIEEKKLRRMGGSNATEIPLDVRLIAASSRSLAEATHYGRLREDLYSRLNALTSNCRRCAIGSKMFPPWSKCLSSSRPRRSEKPSPESTTSAWKSFG